jgi:DNA-binding transcriptional ArsR family regulator
MKMAAQRYVIRKQKQLAALASAARQEIVDVLAEAGTLSVADIAVILGRPADALYFHLRALKLAGLVRQASYRYRGRRKEALFRTISPEQQLQYEPRSEPNRRAVTTIVSSMLRLGIRDFRRAFRRGDVIVAGRHRELWGLRKVSRLTLPQLAAVNRLIERMLLATSKPKGRGRLYAVTVLLTPLDHRRRGAKGNGKREQAGKK